MHEAVACGTESQGLYYRHEAVALVVNAHIIIHACSKWCIVNRFSWKTEQEIALPSYLSYLSSTWYIFHALKMTLPDTITNLVKFSWFWSLATSTVTDNTAVAPFTGLLHRDEYCSTITPLCRTWVPLHTSTLLLGWLPLPLIGKRFSSSALNGELHRFPSNSIL